MITFGSVVYEKALVYLPDFVESLSRQTYKDFSLLLLNDGIDDQLLDGYLALFKGEKKIIKAEKGRSPADLRLDLIACAKEMGVDLLILGDCDDVFSDNRVQKLSLLFQEHSEYSFFYNKIITLDGRVEMQKLPARINDFKVIAESNFLGLSNTALNIGRIENPYKYCFDGDVFDWYFFSRLLLDGSTGLFAEDCFTYYRIHGTNIAGIAHNDRADIEKEICVKKNHYDQLKMYDEYYAELSAHYNNHEWVASDRIENGFLWWNLTKSIRTTEKR